MQTGTIHSNLNPYLFTNRPPLSALQPATTDVPHDGFVGSEQPPLDFRGSFPLRTPTTSDMSTMLDDLQRYDPTVGRQPEPVKQSSAPVFLTEFEPAGDMAQMLEDLKRADPNFKLPAELNHIETRQEDKLPLPEPVSSDMAEMVENIKQTQQTLSNAKDLSAQGKDTAHPADAHEHASVKHKIMKHAGAAMTGLHIALEGAEVVSALAGIAVGGAIGAGLVAFGMIGLGLLHLDEARKHKGSEKKVELIEGSGALILGAKSGVHAIGLVAEQAGNVAMETVAHVAHTVLTPLGVLHGVGDVVLGAMKIREGRKSGQEHKVVAGLMGIGLGVSLGTAAVTAALPAMIGALVFLTAKIVTEESKKVRNFLDGKRTPHESVHSTAETSRLPEPSKPAT